MTLQRLFKAWEVRSSSSLKTLWHHGVVESHWKRYFNSFIWPHLHPNKSSTLQMTLIIWTKLVNLEKKYRGQIQYRVNVKIIENTVNICIYLKVNGKHYGNLEVISETKLINHKWLFLSWHLVCGSKWKKILRDGCGICPLLRIQVWTIQTISIN